MKYAGFLIALAASVAAAPAVAQSTVPAAAGQALASAATAQYGRGSIECRSVGMRPQTCSTPWRRAELARQTSNSTCVEGRTWGSRRGEVWVDRGCGGVFVEAGAGVGPGPGQGGWRPGPGWDQDIVVRCGSPRFNYNMCQVDTGRGSRVTLRRQLSDTRCVEGRNWGWNRAGVWVDQGCSGEFVVERRWR
ncbi:DUF3011 domain-containing protein [Dokdonella sp.]|uniref:DUF3011 domain-containing protein n=1 Tax=Dokdonella sp. TaxID=2291710 RepID=UPI002623145D|nr:DUF3011 domain-containing protein [Dokdonella sp.]